MIRLFSWNILHGGGPRRTPGIVLAILDHRPDVVILSEFRPAMGGQMRGVLADHGWSHQHTSPLEPGLNSMLIASRWPISPVEIDVPEPRRAVCARVQPPDEPHPGIVISAVHIPDARRFDHHALGRKTAFWHAILAHARTYEHQPHVLLGDFNTGRHRTDESGRTFSATALLGTLTAFGYRDAYRLAKPHGRAFSWQSHTGSRFRLDQVHVSKCLCARVLDVHYSQVERRDGWSDHAPMVLNLSPLEPKFAETPISPQKAGVSDLPDR